LLNQKNKYFESVSKVFIFQSPSLSFNLLPGGGWGVEWVGGSVGGLKSRYTPPPGQVERQL